MKNGLNIHKNLVKFAVNPNICRVRVKNFHSIYLGSQVEIVKRDEVSLEESREKAEVNPVSELTVQIIHFQVDLQEFRLILNISTLFPVLSWSPVLSISR